METNQVVVLQTQIKLSPNRSRPSFREAESHPLTSPNEPCADMSATTKKTGYNNKGGSWGKGGRGLSLLKDEWSEKGTESMTVKFLDKSESSLFGEQPTAKGLRF